MKKIGITLAVAAFAVVTAEAQTTSANIVGYTKATVAGESADIFGYQLSTGSGLVSEVIGSSVPVGTKVYTFAGTYAISTFSEVGQNVGFPPVFTVTGTNWNNDVTIDNGAGFWIQLPTGSSQSTAILAGEVNTAASVTKSVTTGANLLSNPYPVQMNIDTLFPSAAIGDKIFKFDGSYSSATYQEVGQNVGFPPVFTVTGSNWTSNLTIEVGEGFWYLSGEDFDWTVNKPF